MGICRRAAGSPRADVAGARRYRGRSAGASVDRGLLVRLLVIGASAMWIGRPGDPSLILRCCLLMPLPASASNSHRIQNAMMPTLVPGAIGRCPAPGGHRLLGGIVSLILVLGFLALIPKPAARCSVFVPLFGLDPVTIRRPIRASDRRLVIIFVLPMFLLTGLPRQTSGSRGAPRGLLELKQTLGGCLSRNRGDLFACQHDLYRRAGVVVRVAAFTPPALWLAHHPDRHFWIFLR